MSMKLNILIISKDIVCLHWLNILNYIEHFELHTSYISVLWESYGSALLMGGLMLKDRW